jgi:hypothetical protein
VKPALRRILRDEQTLQYGAHPLRAILLSGLARPVRQWIEGLDGTRDLERVLDAARAAGLDELRARSLLDQLIEQGALHDAAVSPAPLRDLTLAERDRLRPDLEALDLSTTTPDGWLRLLERRRAARVRVYGAGRVGAQIVVLLAAAGVGQIRVIDSRIARASDITPGGLTWSEVGMTREEGAAAVARRLTSGGQPADAPPALAPAATTIRRPTAPEPATTRSQRPTAQPTASRRVAASDPAAIRGNLQALRPGDQRHLGTQQAMDQRHRGTRQTTNQQHTGTQQSANQRQPPAQPPRKEQQPAALPAVNRRQGGAREAAGPRPPIGQVNGVGSKSPATRAAAGGTRGRPRIDGQDLVRPAVEVLAGGTYLGDRSDRPDLVILAPVGPLDGVLVNELTCLGIPHLPAAAFEGHGSVGPLVLPGATACLHCLDLTRRDQDPAWPIVTARLGGYPPGEIACDTTLATLVAAEATGHALAHIDGKESVVTNGTMDVTPDWRWKRCSWEMHPQCRCMRNNPLSLRMVMSPSRD